MSYSRWVQSRWYTFWHNTDSLVRNKQIFDICGCVDFTYEQLTENIEKCLDIAYEIEKKMCHEDAQPTLEEREELRGYMNQFINAVKSDVELVD
jgi:hypothetical protein